MPRRNSPVLLIAGTPLGLLQQFQVKDFLGTGNRGMPSCYNSACPLLKKKNDKNLKTKPLNIKAWRRFERNHFQGINLCLLLGTCSWWWFWYGSSFALHCAAVNENYTLAKGLTFCWPCSIQGSVSHCNSELLWWRLLWVGQRFEDISWQIDSNKGEERYIKFPHSELTENERSMRIWTPEKLHNCVQSVLIINLG